MLESPWLQNVMLCTCETQGLGYKRKCDKLQSHLQIRVYWAFVVFCNLCLTFAYERTLQWLLMVYLHHSFVSTNCHSSFTHACGYLFTFYQCDIMYSVPITQLYKGRWGQYNDILSFNSSYTVVKFKIQARSEMHKVIFM